MSLEVIRHIIPVKSFTEQPAVVIPTVPEPNIGIRWGKPSDFEFSNQGKRSSKKRGPGKVERPERDPEVADPMIEERVFTGEIPKPKWKKISLESGEIVTFRINEKMLFENTRPVKYQVGERKNGEPIFVDFNITTKYVLNFKLLPEGEWTGPPDG